MCTAIAPEDAFDPIIHEQINKVNAMNTSGLKTKEKQVRKIENQEVLRKKDTIILSATNVLSTIANND